MVKATPGAAADFVPVAVVDFFAGVLAVLDWDEVDGAGLAAPVAELSCAAAEPRSSIPAAMHGNNVVVIDLGIGIIVPLRLRDGQTWEGAEVCSGCDCSDLFSPPSSQRAQSEQQQFF